MSSSKSQSEKLPLNNYGSPCAACKFLRRKCLPDCIFAPYFPANQPQKFEILHRIYGASNISKILNQLSYDQRNDAVNSLVYEAKARLNEPVHGCVGFISTLQGRLRELQIELSVAQRELSTYMTMVSQAAQDVNAPIDLQPLHMPGLGSSSSSSVTMPLRVGNRQSLSEQFPQQMTFNDRQSLSQPYVVDQMSNVRLHEHQLQQQSFDSQQLDAAGQQPSTTMQQPPLPQNNIKGEW